MIVWHRRAAWMGVVTCSEKTRPCADFELVAADAARLKVEPEVIRSYRDWYGDEPVIVKVKGLVSRMPAYEAELRWQMLGERIRFVEQVANAA